MIRDASRQLPEAFTHADAIALGVSDRDLYAMRDRGDITRLARGIYAQSTLEADPDLVEIALRANEATLCLTSALAHHDLTDDIPNTINAALPRTRHHPRTAAPVTWHRFDNDTFDIGRTTINVTTGLKLGLYGPARTIIDAYRLRHLYGTEQALEALKRWLQTPTNQPSELLAMAKHFPTTNTIVRTTLETLL